MATDYIFVYGSLRSEFRSSSHSVLKEHADFIGKATFRGKLYMIDWYPGVVESDDSDDSVIGEVYKIRNKAEVLSTLDHYEGCSPGDPKPHHFARKEKTVQLLSGEEISAWIYIYVMDTSGKEQIASGDFFTFRS